MSPKGYQFRIILFQRPLCVKGARNNCPFVLFVGKRKLVKRKKFEEFISSKLTI
ncbi:MAG: hypothetical protein IJD00_05180 [Clostridia bacterium]|nr:hypothetical protein [Clostridia bacterium]